MLILGVSGGWHLPHEVTRTVPEWQHDAAAVLIDDGKVVAAIEEERLNRIKHTNRAPLLAAQFCLRSSGVSGRDLDAIAYYFHDQRLDRVARNAFLRNASQPELRLSRPALHDLFAERLGIDLPLERFHFVRHHIAHAASAFAMSGFDRSLIVTLDAEGDQESGLVAIGDGQRAIEPIASIPLDDSLGYLYQQVIMFLGYRIFDEYKVMGLAPYGDPATYRAAFKALYTLHADGRWTLHRQHMLSLYDAIAPRRRGEPFTQAHKDFAAALQEMLEAIVMHGLAHYRRTTGERHLCLAGGVAHNCTMNGKILASRLFDRVFIQPAAHDAGAALGAALSVYTDQQRQRSAAGARVPVPALEHLYWGTDVGTAQTIGATLEAWRDFVSFERVDDICTRMAAAVAAGQVIGWVQGRSEFGPRALGNRSIVADPRPAENRSRINAMVKKREAYRPFAPSVLVEDAAEYFDMPDGTSGLPFMICTTTVRPEQRGRLGAVTHVDGSARVQTVSRTTNERFWRLIDAFKALTGVPVLLNTSFNNNVEPIVDSVEDAIVCFLTTGLDCLAVGDWVVRKHTAPLSAYHALIPSMPPHCRLIRTTGFDVDGPRRDLCQIVKTYDADDARTISAQTYELLLAADGVRTIADLCAGVHGQQAPGGDMWREIHELWCSRAVTLHPVSRRASSPFGVEEDTRTSEAARCAIEA